MKFFIATIVSLIAAAVSYIALDRNRAEKIKILAPMDVEEEFFSKDLSRFVIVVITAILTVVAFFTTLRIVDRVSDSIGIIKMTLALVCMLGAACFDFREHRIPNLFPLVMTIGAVLLLATGLLTNQNGAIGYITTSVVAAIACAVVLVLAALMTKDGIGAGDIKLISALALLTGVYTIVGTLFFGVTACALYAVVALLIKRNKVSSGVPFGPFLLFGYIITLFAISF